MIYSDICCVRKINITQKVKLISYFKMAVPSVSSDVAVSIEAIDECQIQEITLDGQEIYVQ